MESTTCADALQILQLFHEDVRPESEYPMSGTITNFRDLDAWKVSMGFAISVCSTARQLPDTERYGLATQMRRAAVSVPANVAEGQSYGEDGRYLHHVRIAIGSLGELATHIEIIRRLELRPAAELQALEAQAARASQLLYGL